MSTLSTHTAPATPIPAVLAALQQYWGFSTLRPLQGESIAATLAGRDVLTVLPTGGGKSLCFQVPPLVSGKLTVVVSPLIALMRDQVESLKVAGVAAGAVHSHTTTEESAELREMVRENTLRVLYVAPERLLLSSFLSFLKKLDVGSIAIDEAHCISQWGHDFRPEYRRLAELHDALPGVPIGAYTATATPRVREDIIAQLQLRDPVVLVGTFDRPNLTYRVLPRVSLTQQICEALKRHPKRAAIVYCISRKDTETIAESLTRNGFNAAAYHAGMTPLQRTRTSDRFRTERLDVVVATVAFGMGIDRSDVRAVIHAAMPKSIEAYQQETGRAGRDGLPAECLLLYSAADIVRWKNLITKPPMDDNGTAADPQVTTAQLELLDEVARFASGARCRHRALSAYFGQDLAVGEGDGCGACDFCLKELLDVDGAQDIARKIISCVARVEQRFGAAHVADVLLGKRVDNVIRRGHDQLSTFGLLKDLEKDQIVSFIDQLVDAGALEREASEWRTIRFGVHARAVLKNERDVRLVEPKPIDGSEPRERKGRRDRSRSAADEAPALTAAEGRIFEALRVVRRELAGRRGVPPFVIFSDATLEDLCRVRPSDSANLMRVRGVGRAKAESFGEAMLAAVREACRSEGLSMDVQEAGKPAPTEAAFIASPRVTDGESRARPMFERGSSIEEVATALGLRPSTIRGYLDNWVRDTKPKSIASWVDDETYARVAGFWRTQESPLLRPAFEAFNGEISYDLLRLVSTHMRAIEG